MSNLIKEKVIKINDKEFKLKFNFRVMMVFEKESNKKFFSFIDSLASDSKKDVNILDRVSAEDLANLFYAFLVGGGNNISKKEAVDLLDLDVFNEFMLLVPQLVAGETKEVSKTDKEVKGEKHPLE